ncbi:MAG: apolipoprotein N-acyltransferase [Planctomycetes bacterium]|mgnify:CR=1 FL=1|jgi:apolipoprotein N-acyltransferase|nr:apolipoprotein N-acyltransferase [Planctomycetota bacterium]MBT4028150.1 apolipoprotein N-acyltransferase [Planctomycetota bacterium]MBT4560725.1 apolipoprotein N-acyltransferase [Planctomycetota bacterium]MBT5101895.1 apolipoprotein N-acyltransferase [Planctomycetota bacterium]MBT7011923.1 apolipoprotein N-acyltransferase [Planctomycetota bacterium]
MSLLLVLLAAVLRAVALPGWLWGGLVLPAILFRILYWERGGNKKGDYLGGVVFWSLAFSFLGNIHPLMPIPVGLIMGWFWVAGGVLFRRLRPWMPAGLAGPGALLIMAWAHQWFPMGGSPWASYALGLADVPAVLSMGSIVGELGASAVLVFGAGCLFTLSTRGPRLALLPFIVTLALILPQTFITWARKPAPPDLQCLGIQANIGLNEKHEPELAGEIYKRHLELTHAGLQDGPDPDVVIWAETMWPFPALPNEAVGEMRRPWPNQPTEVVPARELLDLQQMAVAQVMSPAPPSTTFLIGSHFYQAVQPNAPAEVMSERTSEVLLFSQSGTILSQMSKSELVPFGERLPLKGAFPGSESVAMGVFAASGLLPNFTFTDRRGPLTIPLAEGPPAKIGVAVCWENVFPGVFRQQALDGAEAFVVLSNEAWYGTSAEFDQMLAATQWRAAETQRYILRVTNTGVSALIHAGGAHVRTLPHNTPRAWPIRLPRVDSARTTPYLRGAWAFFPGLSLLLLLLALLPKRKFDAQEGVPFA